MTALCPATRGGRECRREAGHLERDVDHDFPPPRYGPHTESDAPTMVTVGHNAARYPEDKERQVPLSPEMVKQRARMNELAYMAGKLGSWDAVWRSR